MPETVQQTAQPTVRQRNWAPWIGLLLAVAAMLSNAGFFLGFPGHATAWLGVVLVIAAVVCAVIGVMRAFRQPQVYRGKVSSSILGVVSLLICGLVAFASISSRALPSSAAAPQVGQKVPDFTLADTSGNKVSLGSVAGQSRGICASTFRHRRKYRQRRQSAKYRGNAAQGRVAGFLSWLLVTILQPRVTRHPEKPERV